MSNKNRNLSAAKAKKNDEFYTQLSDIEKELSHYKNHFENKTVLCNCDDPFESNFFRYFVVNFNRLGLKKLICTCYAGSPASGEKFQYNIDDDGQMSFNFYDDALKNGKGITHAYKAVINVLHDFTGDGDIMKDDIKELLKIEENEIIELEGDGDFRSPECIELLKEADIICSNPPFSLFREFVALLMEYDKRFLIIGNKNAISYKGFFPLLQEKKVWIGYNSVKEFIRGDGEIQTFGNIGWYTNLDSQKNHETLICVKNYDPDKYPKYDNYNAINVNKVADIPYDYTGVMGVPISFMDKYCPEQFELLGISGSLAGKVILPDGSIKNHPGRFYVNGRRLYDRLVIKYTDTWIASHPDDFKS